MCLFDAKMRDMESAYFRSARISGLERGILPQERPRSLRVLSGEEEIRGGEVPSDGTKGVREDRNPRTRDDIGGSDASSTKRKPPRFAVDGGIYRGAYGGARMKSIAEFESLYVRRVLSGSLRIGGDSPLGPSRPLYVRTLA